MPEPQNTCQGTSPRQREEYAAVSRLKGWSHLSPLTSDTEDMELQEFEFALLGFSLALIQYFLTLAPFLSFGMVMHILRHYMLEVCDLLFNFIGDYS